MRWIEFNKPYKEFVKLKKNIPGVLIEVSVRGRKRVFLIGDINPTASCTDGGRLFSKNAMVLAYKYIWGHWEPSKQSYDTP